MPALPKGTAFRTYVEASGTPEQAGSIRSGLAITNTAATSNTVTLEVTNLDGSLAVPPATLALPPLGQVARFLDEIFDTLPDNFAGVLRVTSSAEIAVVGLRLRINERGELKVTTTSPSNEMYPSTSEDRFFAHIVDSAGWSTQFILFSGTAGQTSSGTLSYFDIAGEPWNLSTTLSASHPDRAALVALYNATDGPNWVNNENWLTDAPLRDWYGVATDASGRVVRVDLAGRWDSEAQEWIPYGLSGPIPPELGSLANLQDLYLNANELTGTIPAELGSLANLTRLDLFENQLSGPIPPELGRLADLESLDVFGNDLSGPIPPELGELASLTRLQLGSNSLTGTIPRSLLDLTKLTRFYFQGNEGLCAPGVAGFADWLGAMEDTSGPYCNESDLGVLNLLYETSGGPGWTNSSR